jgi:endonuclease YncB( thermonuclease family)
MTAFRLFWVLLIGILAISASKPTTLKDVTFVKAHDGDTVIVNIASLPSVFGYHLPIRIAHIDAPEVGGNTVCEKQMALSAGLEVATLLSEAKKIELINPKRDKYFRIVADVLIDDRLLLSQHMLEKKLAYAYEGGTKQVIDWCKFVQPQTPQ